MEIESDGPDALVHVPVVGASMARDLIEHHSIEVISSLYWRTSEKWRIPRRTLTDSMLFIPCSGEISLTVAGRQLPLRPGQIGFMPEGVPHAAAYLTGTRALHVYAVHLHATDACGRHTLALFRDHVQPLSHAQRWHSRFRELTAVVNRDRSEGSAIGRILVLELLSELVLQGAVLHDAGPAMDPRIQDTLAYIHSPGADLRIAHLTRRLQVSEAHFRTLFKAMAGTAPKAYITKLQLGKAMDMLRRSGVPVKAIAHDCGFCSDHYFHQRFKQFFGLTPSECRQRDSAMVI